MRHLLLAIVGALAMCVVIGSCSSSSSDEDAENDTIYRHLVARNVETPIESGEWDGEVHSLPVHVVPGRLSEIFRDTNDLQLTAARAIGIEPLRGIKGAYDNRRSVALLSCGRKTLTYLSLVTQLTPLVSNTPLLVLTRRSASSLVSPTSA